MALTRTGITFRATMDGSLSTQQNLLLLVLLRNGVDRSSAIDGVIRMTTSKDAHTEAIRIGRTLGLQTEDRYWLSVISGTQQQIEGQIRENLLVRDMSWPLPPSLAASPSPSPFASAAAPAAVFGNPAAPVAAAKADVFTSYICLKIGGGEVCIGVGDITKQAVGMVAIPAPALNAKPYGTAKAVLDAAGASGYARKNIAIGTNGATFFANNANDSAVSSDLIVKVPAPKLPSGQPPSQSYIETYVTIAVEAMLALGKSSMSMAPIGNTTPEKYAEALWTALGRMNLSQAKFSIRINDRDPTVAQAIAFDLQTRSRNPSASGAPKAAQAPPQFLFKAAAAAAPATSAPAARQVLFRTPAAAAPALAPAASNTYAVDAYPGLKQYQIDGYKAAGAFPVRWSNQGNVMQVLLPYEDRGAEGVRLHVFGGKRDASDSGPAHTASRELREETAGLLSADASAAGRQTPGQLLPNSPIVGWKQRGKFAIYLYYEASTAPNNIVRDINRLASSKNPPSGLEAESVEWVTLRDIESALAGNRTIGTHIMSNLLVEIFQNPAFAAAIKKMKP